MWRLRAGAALCRVSPVKALALAVLLVAAVAGVARADVSKAQASAKLPASARMFVVDKEAPATEKTTPLPRFRPSLKHKL
jgi:hypothetical protein